MLVAQDRIVTPLQNNKNACSPCSVIFAENLTVGRSRMQKQFLSLGVPLALSHKPPKNRSVMSDEEDIGSPKKKRGKARRCVIDDEENSTEASLSVSSNRSPPMSTEGPCEEAEEAAETGETGFEHDEAMRLGGEMADAAAGGRCDAVLALLSRRAAVDVVDGGYNKWTALMWAGWWGNNSMARALLQAGANPALRDSKGCSAYDVAIHEDKIDTAAIIATRQKAHLPSHIRKRIKQKGREIERSLFGDGGAMEVEEIVEVDVPANSMDVS